MNKQLKLFLLFIPVYINYLFNIFDGKVTFNFISSALNFIFTFLFFLLLFLIGKNNKNIFKLNSISIGIVVYLISFFFLDYLLLFLKFNLSFENIFIVTNIIWITFYILKLKRFKIVLPMVSTFILIKIYNFLFYDYLRINLNFIGDVTDFQLSFTKKIFETSYFDSLNNSVLEGYPQFLNYIFAIFNKILSVNDTFIFYESSSNIILFLTILFFYEFIPSKRYFLIISSFYYIIIFNSDWLKFLFYNSLMVEGLVSYLFCITFISLIKSIARNEKNKSLYLFLFSFMFMTKQFISIITVILIISLFIYKRDLKILLLGNFGLILNELSYFTIFKNLTKNYHLKQFDLNDAIFDLILQRDLEYINVIKIIKNLFVDKPYSYFLLIYLIFIFLYLSKYLITKNKFENNFYILSISLNFIFIFTLYISIWKNMELESPIRYMLSFFHINLFSMFNIYEKI